MVEQAKYTWRQEKAQVVSPENPLPLQFALRHCEKHYTAVATVLWFLKGRLGPVDYIHLSLKKHRRAMLQVVSRSNVLYQEIERQLKGV